MTPPAPSPAALLALLDIGPVELLILSAAAVMLFGGDLPEMARKAGRVMGRLRASARELARDVDPPPDIGRLPEPGSGRPAGAPPREDSSPSDTAPAEGDPHVAPPAERPGDADAEGEADGDGDGDGDGKTASGGPRST